MLWWDLPLHSLVDSALHSKLLQSTLDYPELLRPWKSPLDNKFPDIQSELESVYYINAGLFYMICSLWGLRSSMTCLITFNEGIEANDLISKRNILNYVLDWYTVILVFLLFWISTVSIYRISDFWIIKGICMYRKCHCSFQKLTSYTYLAIMADHK